jgi:hypothetical protein
MNVTLVYSKRRRFRMDYLCRASCLLMRVKVCWSENVAHCKSNVFTLTYRGCSVFGSLLKLQTCECCHARQKL